MSPYALQDLQKKGTRLFFSFKRLFFKRKEITKNPNLIADVAIQLKAKFALANLIPKKPARNRIIHQ